jgi:hypothetical protein
MLPGSVRAAIAHYRAHTVQADHGVEELTMHRLARDESGDDGDEGMGSRTLDLGPIDIPAA